MNQSSELDLETRTRIASFLYKLAIRVMKVSKRPLDTSRALLALDHAQGNRVRKLIQLLTPKTAKGRPVGLQKVLAARTVAPGQGDGIRVDLIFGPLTLIESGNDIGAVTQKTILSVGQPAENLLSLEKLHDALAVVFGGVLPQIKVITADVRDMSDRPFRIEHAYDKDLGVRAWRIVHNGGPKDGQVTFYENPKIVSQIDKNPDADLDPYRPAVFRSAEEASLVLNQLTRGTSISSRNFPKWRERTIFIKYSAVYLKNEGTLYTVFDRLLSEADSDAEEAGRLSFQEKKQLVDNAVAWIRERDVSPDALLSTLKAKDPELAKKYKELLPDILGRLNETFDDEKKALINEAAKALLGKGESPEKALARLQQENPALAKKYVEVLPYVKFRASQEAA